ncbi:IST1 homolog isoform X11 [Pipistrellus kuhlii]|uniref:IST1 homolog isoform X11 n=1 Tax=Pipistrellus kuhlii TaxID=59472 RepID=UPI00174F1D70|nr:IST1 homolog isoform X11 [Pipistrellus kuhlii]
MLGSGFKAERLRVNLRLVINRLKLLEKKKSESACRPRPSALLLCDWSGICALAELAQKARKEIADYLAAGKDERARIRVEHIIREDYLVEAMEILELYCDLLLARFGLIQSMKELDSGLAESVSTLIWAAPRLQSEVAELKIAEAPPGVETDLIDVGFTDDVKKGGPGRGGGGGGFTAPVGGPDGTVPMPMPMPMPSPSTPFSYPLPKGPSDFNGLPMGAFQAFPNVHPPQIPVPPSYESADDSNADKNVSSAQIVGPGPKPEASAKPPSKAVDTYDNFVLPELPSVPDTLPTASAGANTSASEDIDFDDLSRRFEELKKKT